MRALNLPCGPTSLSLSHAQDDVMVWVVRCPCGQFAGNVLAADLRADDAATLERKLLNLESSMRSAHEGAA